MEFMKALRSEALPGVGMKSVRILGRLIALIRNEDGSLRAMEGGCKHQQADLTLGRLQNGIVTCPRHGWQYNWETGACIKGNGTPLRAYACKEENGFIWISTQPL